MIVDQTVESEGSEESPAYFTTAEGVLRQDIVICMTYVNSTNDCESEFNITLE